MSMRKKRSSLRACSLVIVVFFEILVPQCVAAAIQDKNSDLVIGVGTHIMNGSRSIDKNIKAVSDAGLISIRDDASWGRAETRRGQLEIPETWDRVVNAANNRHISVLLILGFKNTLYEAGAKPKSEESISAFVRYTQFVVAHFKGRVSRYEIWNEWDHTDGLRKGDPDDYVNLIRHVYPVIKKADPGAQVLVGAVTAEGIENGFLERIIQLGALDYADGLSLHTYIHCRSDAQPAVWGGWMRKVESDLIWRLGKAVPLYITEMGWPAFSGKCGVDEATQARYLSETLSLARSMTFIKGIWWYDLQDDCTDPLNQECRFGILRQDYTPKPAYQAMKLSASH